MSLKHYVYLWFSLTAYLAFEHWALNYNHALSLVFYLQNRGAILQRVNLSTDAGRPLSYALGCLGIGLILMTNLYVLRRRMALLKKVGSVQGWLNFHIFCGMFGPSCIIFHSDFKVRGLVGISFWSMMIVAVSGIIGRYIYVQIIRQEQTNSKATQKWERKLDQYRDRSANPVSERAFTKIKQQSLRFVGVPRNPEKASLFVILVGSIIGDIRLIFSEPLAWPQFPDSSRYALSNYALAMRKSILIGPFQTMFGYWHSFHLPFAFFMYVAAVIHIAAALMFGITN
jgi:hypothetical protein